MNKRALCVLFVRRCSGSGLKLNLGERKAPPTTRDWHGAHTYTHTHNTGAGARKENQLHLFAANYRARNYGNEVEFPDPSFPLANLAVFLDRVGCCVAAYHQPDSQIHSFIESFICTQRKVRARRPCPCDVSSYYYWPGGLLLQYENENCFYQLGLYGTELYA
jgi:hypothetical protein